MVNTLVTSNDRRRVPWEFKGLGDATGECLVCHTCLGDGGVDGVRLICDRPILGGIVERLEAMFCLSCRDALWYLHPRTEPFTLEA